MRQLLESLLIRYDGLTDVLSSRSNIEPDTSHSSDDEAIDARQSLLNAGIGTFGRIGEE